jgi:hypothetical protein
MPFALLYLRTGWWFLFFGVMWTVALCGFVSKTLFSHRVDAVTVWSCLLLGWMPIATVPSLLKTGSRSRIMVDAGRRVVLCLENNFWPCEQDFRATRPRWKIRPLEWSWNCSNNTADSDQTAQGSCTECPVCSRPTTGLLRSSSCRSSLRAETACSCGYPIQQVPGSGTKCALVPK